MVRPVTVIGLVAPVAVIFPGLEITVYPVITAPPLIPGGEKVMLACWLPLVAAPIVGAPGNTAFTGVTLFDAAEGALTPRMLVAVTVKV